MERNDRLNVNNEFISEVKHTICTNTLTLPPTQVKEVEQINQIAGKGEIIFQLSEHSIKKLKRNWGKKVAKQQHKQCNKTALNTAKERKAKVKADQKMQQRVEARQIIREEKQSMDGMAVMDSGITSTVIQPKDNKYNVIDTEEPSNKIFTVATGELT